jgi:hypothetical protein
MHTLFRNPKKDEHKQLSWLIAVITHTDQYLQMIDYGTNQIGSKRKAITYTDSYVDQNSFSVSLQSEYVVERTKPWTIPQFVSIELHSF